MVKLAIIGGGDLGQQILEYANVLGVNVVGFFDDTIDEGTFKYGIPILGGIESIKKSFINKEFTHTIIAIGYNHLKFKEVLWNKITELNIPFYSIIAPSVYINPSATVEDGAFIMPGVVVDQRSKIGKGSVINCNTTISHDSEVGAFSFLAPGVQLSGFVKVGSRTFIGTGSVTVDHVIIGDDIKIGAGTTVTESLTEVGTYIGSPSKKL